MDLATYMLITIYLISALSFFIYMFKKGNPNMVVQKVKELFKDKKFVVEVMEVSQDLLVQKIVTQVLPLIFAGIQKPITEHLKEHLKEIPIDLGEDFFKDWRDQMNLWWANLHKQAKGEQKKLTSEMVDAVTGTGNPGQQIADTISKKYPLFSLISQIAKSKQGDNSPQGSRTGGERKQGKGW